MRPHGRLSRFWIIEPGPLRVSLRGLLRVAGPLLAAALAFLPAAPLAAQAVRGRVVEQGSEYPVRGAFITMLGEDGGRQGAALTDSLGNFFIRAPGAGRFTLRAHRIGHQTTITPLLELEEGQTLAYLIEAPIAPIVLEEISAAARARCDLPQELGAETQLLWDEARKVIAVVAWVESNRGVPYQGYTYERTRRLLSEEIVEQRARLVSGFGRSPFQSVDAGDLAQHGYVRRDGAGGYLYFGLDATELLSDPFLETHCFRVRDSGPDRGAVIGLGFEPIPTHTLPDITGSLWLHRATFELQAIDFTFTRHHYRIPIPHGPFGGRIEFRRLDNGAWVVDRWWLRMPQLQANTTRMPLSLYGGRATSERDSLIALQRFGLQVREVGGEIRFMGDPAPAAGGLAAVDGIVFDSVRARPLAGATVFLTSGGKVVRTGADGTFRMIGLPSGSHEIAFLHPYADSLGLTVRPRRIQLADGEITRAELFIPRGDGCAVSGDAGDASTSAGGAPAGGAPVAADNEVTIIAGVVYEGVTGSPVAGARVVIEVRQPGRGDAGFEAEAPPQVETDEDGRFLLCVRPTGQALLVEASDGGRLARVELRVRGPGLIVQDFVLRY